MNYSKFSIHQEPYLRFSENLRLHEDYYRGIVRRFADEIGIGCTQELVGSKEIFYLVEREKNQIKGMGYCEFNPVKRTAKFYGASADYLMGISQTDLGLIRKLNPGMKITYTKKNLPKQDPISIS